MKYLRLTTGPNGVSRFADTEIAMQDQ